LSTITGFVDFVDEEGLKVTPVTAYLREKTAAAIKSLFYVGF